MKVQVIVPTAGKGIRFGSDLPKTLIELCGEPMIVHCLKVFDEHVAIDSVILVVPKDFDNQFRDVVESKGLKKIKHIVIGAETRTGSVSNGLKEVDHDTDIVLVHDGARPLVSGMLVDNVLKIAKSHDAVVAAVPVKPTIKRVDAQLTVIETLVREELWEIQTPQVFKKDLLLKAHKEAKDRTTDDAALVEQLGKSVKIVQGEEKNIKITTPEDLVFAEALVKTSQV